MFRRVFGLKGERMSRKLLSSQESLEVAADKLLEVSKSLEQLSESEVERKRCIGRVMTYILKHLTSQFVKRVKRLRVVIMDTRKTVPGLRILDKYAVRIGGGVNHRFGLYDAVLLKENHIAVLGSIKKAISLARRKAPPTMEIEVEAKNLAEVKEAIDAHANTILLDNMNIRMLTKAVSLVAHANKKIGVRQAFIKTEASGGVTLDNVRDIAKTGVDAISIGSLTHSAPALDISLEI